MKRLAADRGNLIAKRFPRRQVNVALGTSIVLLSLAFLAYFIYRNWATLTAYHWQFNYAQLALTVLFDLCAFLVAIWAWHSIVNRLADANDLCLNAKIYCHSAVTARLPGIAWHIATRVVMYDHAGVSKAVIGLASLLEAILIALAGVVFYLTLTPFTLAYVSKLGSWPLIGALALGLILIHPRLVTYTLRKVRKDALPVSLRYRDTLQWLLMYVLTWITSGLLLYATVRSIYNLPTRHLLQVLADWTLAGILTSFIAFVPSSLGLKEITLTLLMSRYMPEYVAVVAAILMRLLTISYAILWMLCSTRLQSSAERGKALVEKH